MIEVLGIIMIIQGVGGFINRVAESSSRSWFVALHVLPPALHIPASIVLALVGAVLAFVGAARRKKGESR